MLVFCGLSKAFCYIPFSCSIPNGVVLLSGDIWGNIMMAVRPDDTMYVGINTRFIYTNVF